ncbi:MAG: PAS domain S-box protein [Candidatus Eisenbacteria bacterium]|nr:PAS domain S-box protein [Candidatus Eisenbacteria bacterium]
MATPDLERFFNLASDLFAVVSAEGTIERANESLCRHAGAGLTRLTGQPFASLIRLEDRARVAAEFARLRSGESRREFQCRTLRADGVERIVLWTIVREEPAGRCLACGCDSSTEDLAPESLPQRRQFRALIEYSTELTILLDAGGTYKYLSPAFESVLGHRADEWLGGNVFDLVWPDDAEPMRKLFERGLSTPGEVVSWQLRFRHADGGWRWLEGSGINYLDNPATGAILITCREVTERKIAEEKLQASSDLLERLAQQVPGVIYQFQLRPDGSSCFPFASDAIRDIYAVTPEQVRDDSSAVFARLHPDDRADVAASIERSARTLEPWRCEYRVVLPETGVGWRSGHARPQKQEDGSILWHGFITDISDRKRAQEELLRKEAALASSMHGIAMADVAGNLTYVNRAFLELWGYTDESEVLGRPAVSFWGSLEGAEATVSALREQGSWFGEMLARRVDGAALTLQVNASQFTDTSGQPAGMLASFLDLTDAKRLRAQLLQAQKMDSLGQLAGGVAHDFNNLLTVMKGYLELAQSGLDPAAPLSRDLASVQKAADSAASLTQQLLAFSRKQVIDAKVLDLNEIVLRVEGMLRRILGEDIDLRTIVAPDLGAVRMDRGQAEQILLNLALNARDAMPGGGLLEIETANSTVDEARARGFAGLQPGEYVTLAVRDTGAGMSDEVKARLFEPFFTTKGPGGGTGLGLATVYGVITQNGGHIDVESEVGAGSLFRILLPRVRESAVAAAAPESTVSPQGRETIVLVEDDDGVRELAQLLLERQGYRVLAFGRGAAAIEAVRNAAEPLHLLLTDVVMPGMNGRELSEAIRRLRPDIRVLFTSGYAADVLMQHGVTQERVEFLAKPYSIADLSRRVREVLERPGG